jgi:hypothetical protein
MGQAARSFVVEHFNRHSQAAEFEELVLKVARNASASPLTGRAEEAP